MTAGLSLAELSDLFTEIGDELRAQDDPKSVLSRLTALASRRVPGADYAGVTLGRSGQRLSTIAATDELVYRVDEIQYELGAGPCVDALVGDTTYTAADLRRDPRWPEFGRRAVEQTGIVSMLSFRLYHELDDDLITVLNMYSHQPEAFDAGSETIGLLLATHGAIAAERAHALRKANHLSMALENRGEIGVAMGILMHEGKITREQAFNLLRITSQHTHRKLVDVAVEVADTGVLPPLPSHRR